MLISLKIDNVDGLSNGGPVTFRAQARSFDIGRENRDWTLPDPDKFISGRHCEIRYKDGAFWLLDVSRNGTFVNGASQRIANPYRLGNGDRLRIGRYIVAVSLETPAPFARNGSPQAANMRGGASGSRSGDFFDTMPERHDKPLQAQPRPSSGGQAQTPPIVFRPLAGERRSMQAEDILRAVADGAGVPPEVFLSGDPGSVAHEIGRVLRTVTDELTVLLKARAAAKALAKSNDRTMVGSADNNPLKFVPGSAEILEIMFARRRAGYLDATHSVEDAFRDLKLHELATYAAMQAALSRLIEELSPDTIERKLSPSSFSSRKGRAWDAFVATWKAKEEPNENGMLDVFLAYFSEAYAKASKPE